MNRHVGEGNNGDEECVGTMVMKNVWVDTDWEGEMTKNKQQA